MKMLINGNSVEAETKEVIEVTNPYTGEVLDTVPAAAKADVDRAITGAEKGQKSWYRNNVRERAVIMRKYLTLLKRDRDEL